jgi:hypothetical protein
MFKRNKNCDAAYAIDQGGKENNGKITEIFTSEPSKCLKHLKNPSFSKKLLAFSDETC